MARNMAHRNMPPLSAERQCPLRSASPAANAVAASCSELAAGSSGWGAAAGQAGRPAWSLQQAAFLSKAVKQSECAATLRTTTGCCTCICDAVSTARGCTCPPPALSFVFLLDARIPSLSLCTPCAEGKKGEKTSPHHQHAAATGNEPAAFDISRTKQ